MRNDEAAANMTVYEKLRAVTFEADALGAFK
jgi:hypothetical protein